MLADEFGARSLNCETIMLGLQTTYPQFHGQGFIGALMAEAIRESARQRGEAHVDCKVWNRSSMCAFDKMAFNRNGHNAAVETVKIQRDRVKGHMS